MITVTVQLIDAPAAGMARLARAVVPGLPHHVTQRGSSREGGDRVRPFFDGGDNALYRNLLANVAAAKTRPEAARTTRGKDGYFSALSPESESKIAETEGLVGIVGDFRDQPGAVGVRREGLMTGLWSIASSSRGSPSSRRLARITVTVHL